MEHALQEVVSHIGPQLSASELLGRVRYLFRGWVHPVSVAPREEKFGVRCVRSSLPIARSTKYGAAFRIQEQGGLQVSDLVDVNGRCGCRERLSKHCWRSEDVNLDLW